MSHGEPSPDRGAGDKGFTMKKRIPAPRSVETTERISGRNGSTMATRPTSVSPLLACSNISSSKWLVPGWSQMFSLRIIFRARRMHRLPWLL